MTHKNYIALATALQRGYAQLHSPSERKGYDAAIAAVSQVLASTYERFDAVRFSATIYQSTKQYYDPISAKRPD